MMDAMATGSSAGVSEGPSFDASLAEALEARLTRLGLQELAAPLGLILGAEADTERTSGLTAQQLQWRVVEATRRVLERLLTDRPLVLVLDTTRRRASLSRSDRCLRISAR